jgi:CheY-like chemotaxis protein
MRSARLSELRKADTVASEPVRQAPKAGDPVQGVAEAAGESRPLVLVVEDNSVIALEIETALAEGGFRVLGPAYTVPQALALLEEGRPDFAVLDYNLAGQPVIAVGARLRELGVPFVLTSAYPMLDLRLTPDFDGVINLGKPLDTRLLIRRIAAVLSG